MNKQDYKASMTLQRQQERIALGLPANKPATFPALAALYNEVKRDIAPTLGALRDWDEYINSGRTLLEVVTERRALPMLAAWMRLTPPPLPVGLPMPPNKVLNARIILPAINV